MSNFLPFFAAILMTLAIGVVSYELMNFLEFHGKRFLPVWVNENTFWKFIDNQAYPAWFWMFSNGDFIQRQMQLAGRIRLNLHRAIILKKIIFLPGAIITGVILGAWLNWWLGLTVGLVCMYGMDYLIYTHVRRRQIQAFLTLPHIIDLIRLQTNNGLNLEYSIHNMALSQPGLWQIEFKQMSDELNLGLSLEEVLDRFATRFSLDDVQRFSAAIKQSKLLGASLAQTLNTQAEAMRNRRKQKILEQTKLAAIKITFPLVFFIFPALLIIFLGPAIMHISALR